MVRIINGEIVQDNDPRLRKRNEIPDPRRTGRSNNESHTPTNDAAAATPQAQSKDNIIDSLAKYLRIEKNIIIIPPIPALKLTESKIGLIYFILIGALTMFVGIKALGFALLMFVVWKHSESR
jgi:hypothetical protein